jgi:hypothetical protein
MSENVTQSPDPPIEIASCAAPALPPSTAPAAAEPEQGIASAPVSALPAASSPALPPEAYAMLELVGRGLAPEADETTRGAARDLWARFAHLMTATAPMMPTAPAMPVAPMVPAALAMPAVPAMPIAPMMPTAPAMPVAPMMPTAPVPGMPAPTTPIAMAAHALRQMPPDQLTELLLQRLRGALPPGVTVPTPKGIQFQLVPVPPPTGSR